VCAVPHLMARDPVAQLGGAVLARHSAADGNVSYVNSHSDGLLHSRFLEWT